MTWGQIKLTTLQKMFSSDGTTIDENDDSTKEYIYSMPSAANEAIRMLVTAGIQLRKSNTVEKTEDGPKVVDVRKENPNFWRITSPEVYKISDGDVQPYTNCTLLAGKYLRFPADAKGTFEYFYDAMPDEITQETPDDTEIEIAEEAAVLIPLYMAGELYKDDELATATYYRNEFEDGLSKLRNNVTRNSAFTSTTGWW